MMKGLLHQLNLFIRSCIFAVCSLTFIVVTSISILLARVFPLSTRYKMIVRFLRFYLWMLGKICHITYRLHGAENIPANRTGIIFCKHQSTWETFLLPTLVHEPVAIAKRELLWVPFFGWALAASNPIAINRKDRASAMQQIITKGKICLEQGRWLFVFPEGTRTPYGTIGYYRLGGARLAAATEAPVLPIAHNAGKFWPRRKFIKYPGVIDVVIGPLIESKGRTPEEILELAKDWIEGAVRRIDSNVYESTR